MKNHITINGKDWYPEEIDTLDVDGVFDEQQHKRVKVH